MLVEFRVENHRSIRSEQAITMEAGRVGSPEDPTPRAAGSLKLLPVAALYGANASGKSNVLSALGFMAQAVQHSHRAWNPEGGIPRQPFAWGDGPQETSLFEVTVLIEGIKYQYGFVADSHRFLEEWLFVWPRGRKQTWLERDGDSFSFGDHLQGENRLVQQVTRENALFLSAAVQLNHEQLLPLYRWFQQLFLMNLPRLLVPRGSNTGSLFRRGWLFSATQRYQSNPTADREQPVPMTNMLALIRMADIDVVDIKLQDNEYSPPEDPSRAHVSQQLMLRHQRGGEEAWLPLQEESQGTRALFEVGYAFLHALSHGGVVVVDELEASLHPLLAMHIVRQFNDPRTNPHNAQLIFTTHDTNLLGTTTGEPALRRDQVWLTEKDHEGATVLYPLTDYKPRKSENLERGYLQGRYGAIPYLGAFMPDTE